MPRHVPAVRLYETAEGYGQKYSSWVKGWAMGREPTGLPSGTSSVLPLVWKEINVWPTPHRIAG